MKLLIIAPYSGQITEATQIAIKNGAKVSHCENVDAAMKELRAGKGSDLIMIDVNLPYKQLLDQIETERFFVTVIACGIGNDTRLAVDAIKSGAKDYVPLPPDPELISAIIAAVCDEKHQMVFKDQAMRKVIALADQICASDVSVLVTGESGTGKEVMAQYLHKRSKRAAKDMVSVNCAAIPENLLESELFGHEKGAFTGAIQRRIGKFEEANGSTLLLDEISEIDIRLQAKLLRAIQERKIDRVGGRGLIPVDIRILATSNRNLEEEISKGNFREDLFYRLNVVNLQIPPLRDRKDDIIELADYFAGKYSKSNGLSLRKFSSEAKEILLMNSWKGNVRELENTIHRAVLLASGDLIEANALRTPEGGRVDSQIDTPVEIGFNKGEDERVMKAISRANYLVGKSVAEVEQGLILDTLDHCLGNRTHAANILGISIRTLRNKLKQYSSDGVSVPSPRN